MKIAHVIDYFHTDVGYQEFFLAREQARGGHRVVVITTEHRHHTVAQPGPDEEIGARELEQVGVDVVRLPAFQLGHDRSWVRGLGRAFDEAAPDVVHCHGPFAPTTIRCVRACRRRAIPVLVDNHIQAAIAPGATTWTGRAFYGTWRVLVAPYLRRHVSAWVANGPGEARFMTEHLGLASDVAEVIPLGFDEKVYSFSPSVRERYRSEQDWKLDDLIVAVTGKIHMRKRPGDTARACEERWHTHGDVRLVLAGMVDADAADEIERAAPGLTEAGRVHSLGNLGREHLSALYQAADIVVFARLPSISVYEAAGTGAKVVIGDRDLGTWLSALHPEIVQSDNPLGVLIPVPDRSGAAERAASTFSWTQISQQFVTRYGEIGESGCAFSS